MKAMRLTNVMVCGLMLAACSAEDDEPRDRYSSGVEVEGSQAVSDLDDTDRRQICESLDVFVDVNVGFDAIAYVACIPAAIVLGGDEQGCRARLDSCMDAFPVPIGVTGSAQAEQVCFDNLAQCDATVAAFEGCVNVNLGFIYDILDTWTCGRVGDQDLQRDAAAAMDTANVCTDVNAACNRVADIQGPD